MTNRVMLALPSKGAIAEPTLQFLSECGLRVEKPNPRQYTGSMPALGSIDVLFQRVIDVVYKVSDGTAQLGITGLDVVREYGGGDLIVIHDDLRYGYCRLLVAVPESWVDVEGMSDLAEIALDFRETKHRNLRIATTYPEQTRQFLHSRGIHHFTLVSAEGAIEAAPTIGYADVIVDLVQTGTTLRENHLKPLFDGVIMESQACLVGNRQALLRSAPVRSVVETLLEYIDAALQGRGYAHVTANIRGRDAEAVARSVAQNPLTRGLQGPTIAPIYGAPDEATSDERWFTITLIVPQRALVEAVEHLRALGATQAAATPVRYVFLETSPTFARLCEQLGLTHPR